MDENHRKTSFFNIIFQLRKKSPQCSEDISSQPSTFKQGLCFDAKNACE